MKTTSEKFLFSLFKFTGLLCVKNTPAGPKFLYHPLIFGTTIIFFTFPITIYGLILGMKSPSYKWMPSTTAVTVTLIHYGTLMISTFVIVAFAALNYKEIGKMFLIVDVIEDKLMVHKKYIRTNLVFSTSAIITILFFVFDYLVSIEINDFYGWYFPQYIYEMIFGVFILQLANVSNRIKAVFYALNAEISSRLKSAVFQNKTKGLPCVETLSALSSQSNPISDEKPLRVLCNLHWDICQAIDLFNNSFKIQLLFLFLTIFIHLIDRPYFIFLASRESISSGRYVEYLITSLLWFMLQAAQLFAIVVPCGKATEMGKETSFLLCKHLHHSLPKQEKEEIRSFLRLLGVHRVDFNCGIFSLDESVISAVTGSVTTYLVILIQFQNQDFQPT